MKSMLTTLFLLFLSITTFAQLRQQSTNTKHIGPIQAEVNVTIEKKDTTRLLFISFQDANYKRLIKIDYVAFDVAKEKDAIKRFAADLDSAIANIDAKESMYWRQSGTYEIRKYDFTDSIYLYGKENGYAIITRKHAETLVQWISEQMK